MDQLYMPQAQRAHNAPLDIWEEDLENDTPLSPPTFQWLDSAFAPAENQATPWLENNAPQALWLDSAFAPAENQATPWLENNNAPHSSLWLEDPASPLTAENQANPWLEDNTPSSLWLKNAAPILATAQSQETPWLEHNSPHSALWLEDPANHAAAKNQASPWLEHDAPHSALWFEDPASAHAAAAVEHEPRSVLWFEDPASTHSENQASLWLEHNAPHSTAAKNQATPWLESNEPHSTPWLEGAAFTSAAAECQAAPWLEQNEPPSASWLEEPAFTFSTAKSQASPWLEQDMPPSAFATNKSQATLLLELDGLKGTSAAAQSRANPPSYEMQSPPSYGQISFPSSHAAELNLLRRQALTELMLWRLNLRTLAQARSQLSPFALGRNDADADESGMRRANRARAANAQDRGAECLAWQAIEKLGEPTYRTLRWSSHAYDLDLAKKVFPLRDPDYLDSVVDTGARLYALDRGVMPSKSFLWSYVHILILIRA